jgi:hypothetical protein
LTIKHKRTIIYKMSGISNHPDLFSIFSLPGRFALGNRSSQEPKNQKDPSNFWGQCKRIASATIPVLELHPTLSPFLSLGTTCIQIISDGLQILSDSKKNSLKEMGFSFFTLSLRISEIFFLFVNQRREAFLRHFLACISSIKKLPQHLQKEKIQRLFEIFTSILFHFLFLLFLCVEFQPLIIGAFAADLLLSLYFSIKHFQKTNYYESICKAILATFSMKFLLNAKNGAISE